MSEIINNFHFIRPWILILLAIPFVMYRFYFKGINAQSSWQKVIDERLLPYLLVKGSAAKRRFFVWSALTGLVVSVLAAAGPSWQKIEIPSYAMQNPVMILLNLSSDMNETDIQPSRLSRAKYKIKDFLGMLKNVQTGLEVYSAEPFIIAPLTEDVNILQNLLPAVDLSIMPVNGDRLDRAIDLAVSKIKLSGYRNGHLVIFTPDVGQKFDLAIASAKKAASLGIKCNIIGVTASSNEKLAMVAEAGGGKYWNLQADDAKIKNLADAINQSNGQLEESKNQRTIWLDAGWYLLAIPMLCCLMFFRRGLLVVTFILISSNAYAGFFINDNQEGLRSFQNADYVRAAEQFKDKNWQGASFYKAGDYQKAFAAYQNDNSTEGLYNQGNALAKSGKIEDAIAKYEAVLELDKNHEDAKFNLEYLKQQQQQQNNQQNQNDNKDQQDQNSESDENNQDSQNDNNQSSGDNDSNQQQQQNSDQQQDSRQDQNSDTEDNSAENEREQDSADELDKNEQEQQGQQKNGALPEQTDDQEEYDEKMQAKLQQYRDIPEDPGGLLKAFIYQEYSQNRYNEK